MLSQQKCEIISIVTHTKKLSTIVMVKNLKQFQWTSYMCDLIFIKKGSKTFYEHDSGYVLKTWKVRAACQRNVRVSRNMIPNKILV